MNLNDAKLVLIRGLPGSGKSTLAKEIARGCGFLHFENDMYFETADGYEHVQSELTAAQQWCLTQTRDSEAMSRHSGAAI